MQRWRLWLAVFMALTAITLGMGTAAAQGEQASVRLDGRILFRVSSTEQDTASARAQRVQQRLQALLDNPGAITPARVEAVAEGAERAIVVAGVPVVTVTQQDADDNAVALDVLAGQWAAAIDRGLEEAARQRLSPLGRFGAEIAGSIRTSFSRLGESLLTVVPRALAALLLLLTFALAAILIRRFLRFAFKYIISDRTLENLIRQVTYYAIWIVGIFLAADALGFEPEVVVTGLGLGGLVLGFALRDVLSNFVSGLLLLFLRPFALGDQIVVGDTEGTVERIDLRATQVRAYDGRVVLVPNAEVFSSRIVNNTADPVRRGSVDITIDYDSDLRRAAEEMVLAAKGAPGVLPDPEPTVRARELSTSGVRLEVRFWTDSRRSDYLATSSAVRTAVVEALQEAGIEMPTPTVELASHPSG
jgi:small conductance mechanosensitive channel